jgi:2-polyprenyl-6-hydroxyphenyl methylase/3-demethylubiquinone-9 3-methyltransferase
MGPAITTTEAPGAARGDGAELGRTWTRFLARIDDDRIAEACKSLRRMLGVESLARRRFLDAGSGGGLASLAAMKLGAERVVSFDDDPQSVACTRELKRRYFSDAANWTIEQGSVLDGAYLERLGTFEVVYSWAALPEAGRLWDALANVAGPVAPGGRLFIAVHRDQGWLSELWLHLKQLYNTGVFGRVLVLGTVLPLAWAQGFLADLIRGRSPFGRRHDKGGRGTSRLGDWVDWFARLPFEVAPAPAVLAFFQRRHFRVENLGLTDGRGCNEFVFSRSGTIPPLSARDASGPIRG